MPASCSPQDLAARFEELHGFTMGLAHMVRGNTAAAREALAAAGSLAPTGLALLEHQQDGVLDPREAVSQTREAAGSTMLLPYARGQARDLMMGIGDTDPRWLDALRMLAPAEHHALVSSHAFVRHRYAECVSTVLVWHREAAPVLPACWQYAILSLARRKHRKAAIALTETMLEPGDRPFVQIEMHLLNGDHAAAAESVQAHLEDQAGRNGSRAPADRNVLSPIILVLPFLLTGRPLPPQVRDAGATLAFAALTALADGDLAGAGEASRDAIRRPGPATGLCAAVRGLVVEGSDPEAARALFHQASIAEPKMAWPLHLLATLQAAQGIPEATATAAACYRAAPAAAGLHATVDTLLRRPLASR